MHLTLSRKRLRLLEAILAAQWVTVVASHRDPISCGLLSKQVKLLLRQPVPETVTVEVSIAQIY
jgi:hypothetical protein